ncbi:hypothetical protein PtB15_11B406 [Puccinia triticina]|nr:hypothetical protein PtB15_11B406 [Puccinia triticina]
MAISIEFADLGHAREPGSHWNIVGHHPDQVNMNLPQSPHLVVNWPIGEQKARRKAPKTSSHTRSPTSIASSSGEALHMIHIPPTWCPVCHAVHTTGLKRLQACKHVFGTKCVDKWFEEHDTCPLCRVPDPEAQESLSARRVASIAVEFQPPTPVARNSRVEASQSLAQEVGTFNQAVAYWQKPRELFISGFKILLIGLSLLTWIEFLTR